MVLATVIRLELAYPGAGIFAGDSLQYLSLATAHGVVMVFFMIIPLISGAFANFLLPTQLGVHDVAFPRLNSAAFWFLPGGLVMLGQLICLDRRYQRMNCFNIREAQSLLKRRFFIDLISSNEHRSLLEQTMIGLRYKTTDLATINSNLYLDINFGLTHEFIDEHFVALSDDDDEEDLTDYSGNSNLFYSYANFLVELPNCLTYPGVLMTRVLFYINQSHLHLVHATLSTIQEFETIYTSSLRNVDIVYFIAAKLAS